MQMAFTEPSFAGSDRQGAFALAGQVGAQGLELFLSDQRDLAQFAQPSYLDSLRQWATEAGVAISCLALVANCRTEGLISQSDATAPAMGAVRAGLAAAAALDAPVLLLPFLGQAALETEDELEFACDRLAELGEEADQAGVTIGAETLLSRNQKTYLSDRTFGVGVQHYYDVANVLARKADPATEIRELGAQKICGIHLKDVRLREGQPAEWNIPLGAGQVDLHAVAQAIHVIGYDGWVTLETPALDDPLANAKANLAFAKKAFGI